MTYVAQDAGFYRKHCLDATLVSVNSGPAGLAQLQSGSLQFSGSSVDNTLVARNKGPAIKIVAGKSAGDVYSIVALKGLPLPDARAGYPAVMNDLVGKKIGVFGVGYGRIVIDLRGSGVGPTDIAGLSGGFQVKVAAERLIAGKPASAAVSRSGVAAWDNFGIESGNLQKPIKFSDLVWSGTPVKE